MIDILKEIGQLEPPVRASTKRISGTHFEMSMGTDSGWERQMIGSGVRLGGFLACLVAMTIVLTGCGGGGSGESSGETGGTTPTPVSISVLEWEPPTTDADGTPMDPKRDLGYYEFYLRTDSNFSDDDLPAAQVSSFSDVVSPDGKSFTRQLTKEFSLDNLLPFTEKGKRYYISIRAVGVDGLKSPFMAPITWDQT